MRVVLDKISELYNELTVENTRQAGEKDRLSEIETKLKCDQALVDAAKKDLARREEDLKQAGSIIDLHAEAVKLQAETAAKIKAFEVERTGFTSYREQMEKEIKEGQARVADLEARNISRGADYDRKFKQLEFDKAHYKAQVLAEITKKK